MGFRVQDLDRVVFHPRVLGIKIPVPRIILFIYVSSEVFVSLLLYFLQVLSEPASFDFKLLDFVDDFRRAIVADVRGASSRVARRERS